MILNSFIIQSIFANPAKISLQQFGSDFFLELADIFRMDIDEDWRMTEAIQFTLHSYPGTALRKVFFDGLTDYEIHYFLCWTEEIYMLCWILGLGEQQNRLEAAKNLIIRMNDIRDGLEVELIRLPDRSLIDRLDKKFYGKKIQNVRKSGLPSH